MMQNRITLTPHIFLFKSLLFILLGFSVTRIIFLIFQISYFPESQISEYIEALVHGIRFDLAVIALLNTPLLLILIFFGWIKKLTSFSKMAVFVYVLPINVFALLANLGDTVYFTYTGRRSGPEIASMLSDVSTQIPQLLLEYWSFVLLSISFIGGFTALFWTLKGASKKVELPVWQYIILCICIVFITTIFARGGLQSKPIRALHAYSWPSSSLGAVVLNTPFTLLRQAANKLKKLDLYPSEQAAYDLINKPRTASVIQSKRSTKQNVVVIILESFALEYFGPPYGKKNYVPFLTSLAEQSRFFPNGIANGRRSIEAVPSILAGMPSLMSEAFPRSPFQSNKVFGVGEIVKPYGYSTAFFHGAKNGSMYFDATTYRFGFDQYFGRNEHPNDDDFDGQWGIYDEPFLQFTADKLNQLERPFISGVFTISSHPPYRLPAEYEEVIPVGEIPMHRVIQYSDLALKNFFEKASTMDWYEDTLFVITADHTSDNADQAFATPLGRHQIPLMLFHPSGLVKPSVEREIAQQVDIPETIIDFLELPERAKLLPFGRSLLRRNDESGALIKEEGSFWYLSQGKYVKLRLDNSTNYEVGDLPSTFTLNDSDKKEGVELELHQQAKAYLQLYFNGLINNQHYHQGN